MTKNAPSEALVEAMAQAIYEADDPWHVAWPWPDLQSDQAGVDHYRRCAEAAAAVIADALAERDAEIARLRKLVNPTWFYHPDCPETCYFSPWEVIDEEYDPAPGEYVFEVDCATSMPSIWCAVHVSDDTDADERFTLTEHASEAEARAALGEPQ